MANPVALNPQLHAQLRVDTQIVLSQPVHMVPVVTSEFLKLCIHFPIVISKQADTGQFHCSALLGLQPGENLFADAADCLYWPANFQRQPFFLGQAAGDQGHVVCIDAEHACVSAGKGQALYEQGVETPYLRNMKQLLAELVNGVAPTQAFLSQLAALNLLLPMQLEITAADGQMRKLNGLYTVDEQKLQRLPDADLLALRASGSLSLIYTMLASQGQIYALVHRQNARVSAAA